MSEERAIVAKVTEVTTNDWGFYNLGLEGYKRAVGVGSKYAPKCKVGDTIECVIGKNDRGYDQIDSKTIKVVPAEVAAKVEVTPALANNSERGDKDRQQAIHFQSSRKDAIAVMGMLLANGVFPLDDGEKKPKEADKYDFILTAIDKLSMRFYQDLETKRLMELPDVGEE